MPTRPLAVLLAFPFLAASAAAQYVEPGISRLFAIPGRQLGDLFGWRVRAVGDTNSDGVADFAVAAPFHNLNVGRVSVHSGTNGSELWFRDGTATSSILGFDLCVLDDIDGDGVREVVAGAPFANGTGLVHVWSGRTGALLRTLTPPTGGDFFGVSVAAGGDYNGDGARDLAIADDGNGTTRQFGGQVFVYTLPGLTLLRAIAPPAGGALFGTCLAFVGDVDFDGRDELAVGDRLATTGSPGRLHVVGWNGTADVVRWTAAGMEYGSDIDGNKLDGGGDLNGDFVPDVIVDESFPTNRARLFSGANGSVLHTFTDGGTGDFGKGAKIVDDQNHDGIPDLLMGGPTNSASVHWNGRLVLFSGRDFRRLRQITNTTLDALFGRDADLLPDVNGDGAPEIVVGASGASGFTRSMGSVHLVAGDPFLAGWQNYGSGTPGTLSVPALTLGGDPVLGQPFTLVFGNSAGVATSGLFAFGLNPAVAPTPWGGTLLVDAPFLAVVALPVSGLVLPLVFADDPLLRGLPLYAQTFFFDGGATGGVAESRGLQATLGR